MPDAVIVAAARTPIGTARKGTLLDVSAFDLAKHAAGEALKRSGIAGTRGRRHADGRVAAGRRRHRPLRRDRARPARGARRRAQPPLRVGHGGGAGRGRQHHGGHGHASSSPAAPRACRPHPWCRSARSAPTTGRSGCRRRIRSSPTRPRSTCRSRSAGTRPRPPGSPARTATRGQYRSHMRATAGDRRGPLAGRDRADRGDVPRRHNEVFDTDEHPRRDSTIEKMASLKPLHPEIEDFPITAGNASGLNDAAAAMIIVSCDFAEAHGLHAAREDRVVGVVGPRPGRHRPRADRRDPEGAGARGPDGRRRRSRRDQRGVRVACPWPRAASSACRRTSRT